ncbi:DUF5647 family protein [Thermus amyloliquefaciens]|uniref:DUF5647 family protein n=1 Tax=Thermus amyloliquefaciens TaxID=1449080 RepID=UPI0009DEDD51|nr:DUF5647 family protein [Thermus amyloliquefaciens]
MVNPAERLAELDGILMQYLLEADLLRELPPAYRLVLLPLDEPEVAAKALAWAREAPNPEGWPLVYALFLEGRPVRLLLPGREVEVAPGPPRGAGEARRAPREEGQAQDRLSQASPTPPPPGPGPSPRRRGGGGASGP